MDKIATKEALEKVSQALNDKIEAISGSVPNIIGDISDLSSPPVEISISRCDELSNCLYLKNSDNELLPRIDPVLNLMEVFVGVFLLVFYMLIDYLIMNQCNFFL